MTFRHADAPTFVIPENVPVHKLLSYFLTEQMVQREPLKAWDFYFMSRRKGFLFYVTQKGILFMSRRKGFLFYVTQKSQKYAEIFSRVSAPSPSLRSPIAPFLSGDCPSEWRGIVGCHQSWV